MRLSLRAVQAVRGGNGGGAERAAAQCEQRPSSAVYSHERSEVDGILIRFAELPLANSRVRVSLFDAVMLKQLMHLCRFKKSHP